MAGPTVTLSPTSGSAGTTVTVTVVRDVPQPAPVPVTITATTAAGSGTGTFEIIGAIEALTVGSQPARTLSVVSDDGTTQVSTFVA